MMGFWRLIALVWVLLSAPAWAQAPAPPPTPVLPKPPQLPVTPQPDWYLQKKCPAFVDCMPTWDKERAQRCEWVKAHCPDTRIVY